MTQKDVSPRDHYFGVVLEDIQSKVIFLAEAMSSVMDDVRHLKKDMAEVKQDIRVIKLVITDHNHHIDDHEGRITALELEAGEAL